jgi:hypothetical protein
MLNKLLSCQEPAGADIYYNHSRYGIERKNTEDLTDLNQMLKKGVVSATVFIGIPIFQF